MADQPRPIGINIIGFLFFIIGILELFVGIGLILIAGLSQADIINNMGQNAEDWLKNNTTLVLAIGLVILAVAIIDMVIGYGSFKGWGWVWPAGLVFAFLSLILSLFTAWARGFTLSDTVSGLVGAVIPIVIILYLNTKKVRAWFGRSV
jgi:hypothetical protein